MFKATGLTIDEVRNQVDPNSFFRGKDYFTQGRVENTEYNGETLKGQVQGAELYTTKISIKDKKIIDTHCSCPVGSDCKHVVALGLKAILLDSEIDKREATKLKKIKPAKTVTTIKATPSWIKQIENLERPAYNRDYETQVQLQIFITIEEERYGYWEPYPRGKYAFKLRPRITDPKEGTFSISEVTWRYIYNGYNHIQWNNKIYHLSPNAHYYLELLSGAMDGKNSTGWAQIPADKLNFVWELLKEHKKYGVELVAGRKDAIPASISQESVEAFINIENTLGGNIAIAPKLIYKGNNVHESIFPVGDPPKFVVFLGSQPIESWYRNTEFILAPVRGNIPTNEDSINEIIIPKDQIEFFKTQHLSKLARHNSVRSQVAQIIVPTFVMPEFTLAVEKVGKNKIKTVLRIVPLKKNQHLMYDETEVAQNKEAISQRLLKNYHIWPNTVLEGVEAAKFVTQTLHQIETSEKLKTQIDSDVPKFVYDTSKPQIELGVSQSDSADWFDLDVKIKIGTEEAPLAEIITALAHGEEYVLLDSGRYFSISDPSFEKLRTLIKEARGLQDQDKSNQLKISRFQVGFWEELQKLGIISKQAKEWKETVTKLNNIKEITPQVPAKTFLGNLRSYQEEGLSWLYFLRSYNLGGILADDMGLGKTVQTISLFTLLTKKQRQGKPFLVVAPTSVVENWDGELERFAPSLNKVIFRRGDRRQAHNQLQKADVVLISYSLLVRDFEKLKAVQFDTIFLDEAQMAKNYQSKAYGLIKQLKSCSKIALTGTPMENNLLELWTLFSLVAPGLFPHIDAFKENFRKPIEKEQNKEALAKLRSRIRPFMLRRKKEIVEKELPLKTVQTLFLEMMPEHKKIYDLHLARERQRVLGLMAGDGLNKNRFDILKSLTIMRQLCLHPQLIDAKHKNVPSAKIEALTEHIELLVAQKHKVLIFSQFTSFLVLAREVLDKAKLSYLYLDGGTKDRGKLVKDFQNGGAQVFLISLKAGGFGLNLTEADFCILLDPWWNPQVENQAIDRMHRIGQTKPVFVYKFIVKGTVEEKVLRLQEKKSKLFAGVLEDGNIFGSQVTGDDIKQIFA